ncbi:MAG: DUF3293 domain-containing protein [Nitriliruptoraceae bacterium]|nr:DUF3293 domain-containing protein [Nitriliruptoraceae bacterium]
MSSHDALTSAYLAAVVELALPDGPVLLEPAPLGVAAGVFPAEVERVTVLTACNPRSELQPAAVNAARQHRLAELLRGLDCRWWVPAEGRSVDGTWREASFAVADADEVDLLALAADLDQHAIYAWSPTERAVVWTDDGHRDVTGWRSRAIAS